MFESISQASPWSPAQNEILYNAVQTFRVKYAVIFDSDWGGAAYWMTRSMRKKGAGYVYIVPNADAYSGVRAAYSERLMQKYAGNFRVVPGGVLDNVVPYIDMLVAPPDVLHRFADEGRLQTGAVVWCKDSPGESETWRKLQQPNLYRYFGHRTAEPMVMPSIDLLVPSRERPEWRRRLMASLASTKRTDKVKLTFGIDTDDPSLGETVNDINKYSFADVVEIPCTKGSFPGLGWLWNHLAKQSSGQILAMIGDDMVFETVGWDQEIGWEFSSAELPGDQLKMVYCNDGFDHCEMAVNLFLHRKYVDTIGRFMREEFRYDMVDIWLQEVFTALRRIWIRPDIVIRHLHWSRNRQIWDDVTQRMRGDNKDAWHKQRWEELRQERIGEIETLAKIAGVVPDYSRLIYFKEFQFKQK